MARLGTSPKGWATSLASEQAFGEPGTAQAGLQVGPQVLFEERRLFTPTFIAFGILLAIGNAWGYAANYDPALDIRTAMFTLGVALVIGAVLALVAWAPGTSECKSIRIDRTGLTVGRQFLPAGEVGHCALLPEYEAGRAARKCRYQDTRIGRRRMSYNYLPNSGPAVFVCQKGRDLARPGWLIASRDPERLLAALTELRSDVAGQAR